MSPTPSRAERRLRGAGRVGRATTAMVVTGSLLVPLNARADDASPVDLPEPSAPLPSGQVLVNLEGLEAAWRAGPRRDVGFTLERRRGPGAAWTHVCDAPCEVAVPVVDSYRVVGAGLNPSKAFMLANGPSRIALQVAPASHAKYLTGAWLLGGGAMLVAVGATVIIVGANPSFSFDGHNFVQNTSLGWLLAGSSLVVGGVIGAILGASLAFGNAQTVVRGDAQHGTDDGVAKGESSHPQGVPPAAVGLRHPSEGAVGSAPATLGPGGGFMVPLLNLRF